MKEYKRSSELLFSNNKEVAVMGNLLAMNYKVKAIFINNFKIMFNES